jgi:polysaccharide biosynthesis protein VpsM
MPLGLRIRPSAAYRFASLALTALPLLASQMAIAGANTEGPASFDIGTMAVTPTLGMHAKYRDNIYLQDKDPTSSWIYRLSPAILGQIQDRDNIYQLRYRGEAGWYDEDSRNNRNNYFDHFINASAKLHLAERWLATADASWAQLHEDRGTGLTEGDIGTTITEPLEYDKTRIGGSLQYGAGSGSARVKVNGSYSEKEYQNFRDVTRNRNLDTTRLGTTFFYPIGPRTDTFLEYRYKKSDYPNQIAGARSLDSDQNAALIGLEWEVTPDLTRSSVRVGWQRKSFDEPSRNDNSSFTWALSLWMSPTDRDTVFVQGSGAPDETALVGDYINRNRLLVNWTHNWSDRVHSVLGASYGRDQYENTLNDREDDIYTGSIRVAYQFRRWASIFSSYEYAQKDSSSPGLDYTDHIFQLGIDLSL